MRCTTAVVLPSYNDIVWSLARCVTLVSLAGCQDIFHVVGGNAHSDAADAPVVVTPNTVTGTYRELYLTNNRDLTPTTVTKIFAPSGFGTIPRSTIITADALLISVSQ